MFTGNWGNRPIYTSKFSIKNLVKVFFDLVNLKQNRNPSYFSKNLKLTNQNIFWNQDVIQPFCLSFKIPPKGNLGLKLWWCKPDKSLTKFSLRMKISLCRQALRRKLFKSWKGVSSTGTCIRTSAKVARLFKSWKGLLVFHRQVHALKFWGNLIQSREINQQIQQILCTFQHCNSFIMLISPRDLIKDTSDNCIYMGFNRR